MSDPIRLSASADAPRALQGALRAAKASAPVPASVDAIVAGVLRGLPGGGGPGEGGPGSTGPEVGPADGGPPVAPAPAAATTAVGGSGAASLFAGAAATAAIAGAIGLAVLAKPEPPSAPAPAAPVVAAAAQTAAPIEIAPTPSGAAVRLDDLPDQTDGAAKDGAATPPPPEAELLDRAQRALGSDPAAALRLCDEHARFHPGGALAQEREVIAIDALVRTGRVADAKARADRFAAAYPASGHLRRIEVLLGE